MEFNCAHTYRKVCNALAAFGLWNRGGKVNSRKKSKHTIRQAPVEHEAVDTNHKIDTLDVVDTLSSEGESSDGIPYGPYSSSLYYDEENTDLNPRRYGLDRVNSGACEFVQPQTSRSTLDILSGTSNSSSEEEVTNVISSTSSSSGDEYPKVSFMIRLLSIKIIDVTFSLSQTIDDVRTEIQSQFGLVPSQYILKAGYKALANNRCSLLDYNIQSNQTLDIVPRANCRLPGGANNDNDIIEVEDDLGSLDMSVVVEEANDHEIPELPDDPSRDPLLEWRVSELQGLLKRRDFPCSEDSKTKLIKRIREGQANGWQKKQQKTSTERVTKSRAKRSTKKKEEDNDKAATRNAQVRANETEEETWARQENNTKQMARARADKKNAIAHKRPTLHTLLGDTPGKDYKLDNHTDDVITSLFLFHLKSGEWMFWESEWMIAYIHVLQRLGVMSKLNSLLELCLERRSTLLKTLYQAILDDNDLKQVQDWIEQEEERLTFTWEEAVLVWFATNDSISLEDRKAKLRSPEDIEIEKKNVLIESLVGLHLNVSAYWWPGWNGEKKWPCVIESIKLEDDKERYFNLKCLDHDPNDPHQEQRYEMAYVDVQKYADRKHPEFSDFYLPKTLDEGCVDLEFNARCESTLQELRKLDEGLSSSSADEIKRTEILYNYAIQEVKVTIRSQKLTAERKSELMSKFYKAQGIGLPWGETQCFTAESIDAPLVSCSCCGIRNMDTTESRRSYKEVDLSKDNVQCMLKLKDGDDNIKTGTDGEVDDEGNDDEVRLGLGWTLQRHRLAMQMKPLSIPCNDDGDTKEVETWRLKSVWPAKKPEELVADKDNLPNYMFDESGEPVYYHLHPEFVQEKVSAETNKSYTATICSECEKVIESGGTPELPYPRRSIAAGVDFGDANRIGLEPLTERERQMTSKIRQYLLVIKIESNTADGRVRERGQSAVKGCGIFFNHDSPHVVSDLLSQESLNGDVTLQFVGPEGEYDALAAKVMGSANVEGRAWVIHQWLAVLQEVNEHYIHDDALPEFNEVKAKVKAANEALVKDAGHIDDKNVLRETEIAKDDARHIRTHGGETEDEDDKDGKPGGTVVDIPLRCSFITSATKNRLGTDEDRAFLESAKQALGVDDDQQAFVKAMSRREENPLNEYDNGDMILAKACPDLFMFGYAYHSSRPTLNKYETQHLLMQYTASAGSNRHLLCQLFESNRRHSVISNMHAKVSSDPKAFDQFANEFASAEFQAKLQAAIKNPNGSDAKYVLNKLTPLLTFAGRKSAFGALERNESAGQILALGRQLGCSSSFLTFGIDDINHPNAIRFALRSTSNHDFPAVNSKASQNELKTGIRLSDKGEGTIRIPQGYTEKLKLMNNNPVGAAMAFKQVVHDIMSILFGIKPSNYSGDNNRTTTTEFKKPDEVGMSGTPWAFFGKNETTHSGSLHFHVVGWSGLPPKLLEHAADIPELCEEISSVLDSQFTAKLDRHFHIQDLVKKTIPTIKGQKSLRDAAKAKEAPATSAQDTSVKDTSDVREDTSDINDSNLKDIITNGSDNDSDVHMEGVSHPLSEPQTQDTPSLANSVQDTSNASRDTSNEMGPTDKRSDMTSLHASPTKVSELELELETPAAATLPSSPEEEADDIVGPPNIKRRVPASTSNDTSVPGAFAEFGKTLNRCQNVNCQHGECNQNEDTGVMSQQFPGINMVSPTKPLISFMDARKRKGGNSIGDTNETVYSSRPTPLSLQLPPDPNKDSEQFNTLVVKTIRQCGIHKHTFTCKKPPKGWHGCRLCYDKALNNGTKPKELVLEHENDGTTTIQELYSAKERPIGSTSTTEQEFVKPYDPEKHTVKEELCYPLPSPKKRNIIWELDRPELEPLDDLDDDMTKEQIISKLYNEMLLSTTADEDLQFEEGSKCMSKSQVDLHQFYLEQDGNHLFLNLLLGLIETSQIKQGSKSVEEFRRELMQCLTKLPLDCKLGDKTIEEHIKSRMSRDDTATASLNYNNSKSVRSSRRLESSNKTEQEEPIDDTTIEEKVELYSQLMLNVTGDDCFEGGALEVYLFARLMNVNVALYDEEGHDLTRVDYIAAKGDKKPTIHLLRAHCGSGTSSTSSKTLINTPEYKYKLFTPKLKRVVKMLEAFDVIHLRKLYDMVSKKLPGRNGKVVDYNDMLTSVLGCNSNFLHLGSTEQSKAALFYIGPYINKDGVKLADALPILEKAREHAQKYPSTADDTGTAKRSLQHVLTRVLNKLNGMIEISDTQIAASLLGMGASLCSESFVTCDIKAYQKFVNEELQRLMKSGEFNIDEDSDEENEYYDERDILNGVEVEDSNDSEVKDDLEEEEASQPSDPMECEDANDTRHAQSQNEEEGEDFAYINASCGSARLYTMNDNGTKQPVSYAARYRYRGEALKSFSRYEYCALIDVVESGKDSTNSNDTSSRGRKTRDAYSFGVGLGIDKKYHQVLKSKQCIPKLTRTPPSPPKKMPQPLDESDDECNEQYQTYVRELAAWRKKADKFAHFYLTLFRPEDTLYEKGQVCTYKYDWESFTEYYNQLRESPYVIGKLRLDQIDRCFQSWRVDPETREMLALYRGRAREMWTAEQIQANKAYFGRNHKPNNDEDGMDYISDVVQDLNSKESTNARKHLGHSKAIINTLNNLFDASILDASQESSPSTSTTKSKVSAVKNVSVLPFNMDLAESIRKSHLKDTYIDEDGNVSTPNMYRTIPDLDKKVSDYIKSQDLSADKSIVIQLSLDHFKAIRTGEAQDPNYNPTLQFVSGKPGNGKSKIIETLDGIVEIMKVGEQMKNAYMGSAAVGIRGTTLLKSWNIPVFNEGEKVTYRPWNMDELNALKRRFGQNVDNICAVIVDEISTVQPYMLAYLNIRMQQLFENDKPFGGRMVILLGDFDQKPPTSGGKGNTLPGSVMQYFEQKCEPLNWKSAEKLGLSQMGGYLFTKFRHIKLTSQHRSGDPEHMAVINKMSRTGVGPTIRELKSTYKKLSAEDLASDDFRFATTIVTGNLERREINAVQSKRWAKYHGVNTVRWPRKREEASWKGRPRTEECIAHAMQNACFWEWFPPGAMGYLNSYNINGNDGLTNGTVIKFHSLSFEDKEQRKQFNEKRRRAKPGDVIDLDSPPTAINVELFADFPEDTATETEKKKVMRKEWLRDGKGTLTKDGRIVIPISTRHGSKIKSKATYIPGCLDLSSNLYYQDSQIKMKDYFPIEPAFSITVDKAQGKTIHRLVLSISKHLFHLNKITWEGLYVSLSRVRSGNHMRLLINGGDWNTVTYIPDLRRNKYTEMFFKGYKPHPDGDGSMIWDFELAIKEAGLNKKRKVGSLRKKKKSTPKKKTRKK